MSQNSNLIIENMAATVESIEPYRRRAVDKRECSYASVRVAGRHSRVVEAANQLPLEAGSGLCVAAVFVIEVTVLLTSH